MKKKTVSIAIHSQIITFFFSVMSGGEGSGGAAGARAPPTAATTIEPLLSPPRLEVEEDEEKGAGGGRRKKQPLRCGAGFAAGYVHSWLNQREAGYCLAAKEVRKRDEQKQDRRHSNSRALPASLAVAQKPNAETAEGFRCSYLDVL
jgi:hypothetical protein